ncbi:imidazolonepropionase-like amidohydrolase [Amycolatopsis sulphurea]|uniref:Imidazolonepropionase-like amidohydrolase n=1 Tax=Amycolatopsis sulphurea TaxID=76022 RepID=A0A2A9G144_9PSEU|nr:amidohydrolase family protein [Amycolatopsis sulphurea]PFG57354.1 imidazolonepropionase-like amidohydrolase [Amycolatopsis sulphurea]
MSRFAVTNTRVFTGTQVADASVVVVADGTITSVGHEVPPGLPEVDGRGGTLLPGLIDAHTHSDEEGLRTALDFGVTTELDMMSVPAVMTPLREKVRTDFGLADVRSSSWGLAHPDGHPHQVRRGMGDPVWPTAAVPEEAAAFVEGRLAEGADYLKIMVEDGAAMGTSLPRVPPGVVAAAVAAAHEHGMLALVHTFSAEATRLAVDVGADGVTHLLYDEVIDDDLLTRMRAQDMFVISTLAVTASAAADGSGPRLAADRRVASRLDEAVRDNLSQEFGWGADLSVALRSVARLREAGVEILAGTDASHLGGLGLAHGASLHDELRLLEAGGFSPVEALNAATRRTADRFGLSDRGRIEPGAVADLLLVDGDPTTQLSAMLNTRAVWRRGHRR